MHLRRRFAALSVATVTVGAGLALAAPVSADEIWFQSVGRASAEAACPSSSPEDVAAGWTEWGGSWEQWMNDGTGGFTCNRSIVWARSAAPGPASGCQLYSLADGSYVDFGSATTLAAGSPTYASGCSELVGTVTNPLVLVDADDVLAATTACAALEPGTVPSESDNPRVFSCVAT